MKYTIDRFEEDLAVLEVNGNSAVMSRALLPSSAKEGDVVDISLDPAATAEREKEVRSLFARIFRRANEK